MTRFVYLLTLLIVGFTKCPAEDLIEVSFEPDDVGLQIPDSKNISIVFSRPLKLSAVLIFTYQTNSQDQSSVVQEHEIVKSLPNITVVNGTNETGVTLIAVHAGIVSVGLNTTSPEFDDLTHSFLTVKVMHSHIVDIVGIVIGWIYFAAWSISFYPQIVENIRRKSVQGLSFDFVAYNLTGHFCYGVFNVGLYWSAVVQKQYFANHPHGVNPVQLNDVVFSLHATAACIVTALQCVIYESGGQRVSRIGRILLALMWVFLLISLFVAVGSAITWLLYLYFFSYVKLAITLIKYVPQAVMNFRRKSTVGWSIGNILLDFTGGILSMLQMFLIAYNTDDWNSVMGDPTKFGLGLFSVLFDILFIVQHYVLYRHRRADGYVPINSDVL